MSYQAFDARVFPLMIFYVGLIIFSVLLTVAMYRKWQERKTKPVALMTALFALFTSALIMLAIGLGDSVISGFYREIYRFSLPCSYAMIAVADIILFIFAREITNHWKKGLKPVILIGIILCVVLFLPCNWWGYPNSDYVGQINIRLETINYTVGRSRCYLLTKRSGILSSWLERKNE